MSRIAHLYRLPVSTVYGWPHSDLVAAVASLVIDSERCPGCGMDETQAWWVEAELVRCPTCEDRDRLLESVRDQKSTAGMRARFSPIVDVEEAEEFSSAARYTLEGARRRAVRRSRRRPTS